MKIAGKIIKQIIVKEGDLIDLHTPDEKRVLKLKNATWEGEYAIIKHVNGNVYDFLYRPQNRKTWELLALEIRYGKTSWQRHISPYKVI